ncbi:Glycerol-3-phosphate dehydrogenase [Thalictrum thalictroides]|uniref:Glycerol-3-phosphate dehydrogenase n=1 Tax=Thalictrum thalictroides TaxID=46969 RepID=A0A7J6V7M8_THATH|nr:Glycerol-3-phosphate dehydrogenase [Thalictrum thalictroides]
MRRIVLPVSAAILAIKLGLDEVNVMAKEGSGGVGLVKEKILSTNGIVPSRVEHISKLADFCSLNKPLDVLVIGGGATGSGVALDAATRGLNVGLVEKDDFSSGTSSRSTKLLHGGVRYLEKAFFNLDYGQLKLVFHALEERNRVIQNAPHMCHPLPTMTPCFTWFDVVYYWAGLKAYDLVAGSAILQLSYYYPAKRVLRDFPTLAKECDGRKLRGAVVYYDGQMNDSRLNVEIACTAALAGASVLNHAEVTSLLKDKISGRVIGAHIRDNLTDKEFDIYAKVVVNATGPFSDTLRKMANKDSANIISPASGAHVILPDYYTPKDMGLIIPKTKDGRVVFILPWNGKTVVGTTDSTSAITDLPKPREDEIEFILNAISDYLNIKVGRSDILSTWSGIRPLATDPSAKSTSSISRDHIVNVECPGFITITGGKWTTYRSMAEDVLNTAIKHGDLSPLSTCVTADLPLMGAYGWEPLLFVQLARSYVPKKKTKDGKIMPEAMDTTTAKHLSCAYGSMAKHVAIIAQVRTFKPYLVSNEIGFKHYDFHTAYS